MAGIPFVSASLWNNEQRFKRGSFYLVNAPSGTGKSSFLAFTYGLRKDYKGTIHFDDVEANQVSLGKWSSIRQRELSVVLQELKLFPQVSAMENIQLKNKLTKHCSEKQIREMAAQLGMDQHLNQRCGTLSLGQQQRIAIIRALVQPFDFLLLDEPFSHIDEANIKAACELIQEVCKEQGAGMILTSLGDAYNFDYDQTLSL